MIVWKRSLLIFYKLGWVANEYQLLILRCDTICVWNIVIHHFWGSFSAICFGSCESIYCHFNEKTLFKFPWLEFRFKSFLELHVHFKGFMGILMRILQAECQIPAEAHDWCQIVFSFNVPKFIPKYWTTKQLSQFFWMIGICYTRIWDIFCPNLYFTLRNVICPNLCYTRKYDVLCVTHANIISCVRAYVPYENV